MVVVLDVVVVEVVDVVGGTEVELDGETTTMVDVVTSVGATPTDDVPHAAARRPESTATQAAWRIGNRLASGALRAVDHPTPLRSCIAILGGDQAARGLDLLGTPEMLQHIDSSLESFLRTAVGLDARDVDIAFDPPDREWGASLNRPTLNVFLWSITRDTERDLAGQRATRVEGRTVYAHAPVPIDLRYLITAWSASHEDEKQLLGATLTAIAANRALSTEHYPTELDGLPAAELALSGTGGSQDADLWNALDGQLKPGIQVVLRTYVPGEAPVDAGPPVESLTTAVRAPESGATAHTRRVAGLATFEGAPGTIVQAPTATTTINAVGRFALRAEPGDELIIHTDPVRRVTVPDAGGVVID